MNKIVYQYDEKKIFKTKLLLDDSDLSPSGNWNIPADCTEIAPPAKKENYVAVWNGAAWVETEDYRGKEYWLPGDTYGTPGREVKEIGPLPEGATLTPPEQTLEEAKAEKHREAGASFAQKRDAIRQVQLSDGNTYGFDCANEDITNFMASWKAAEVSGSTPYKVWGADGSKGMITMQLADFKTVFNAVRESQLAAYAWYGAVDAQIQAATTKEELDAIVLD